MGKPVVIFGTGDFAEVADVYLANDSPYEVVAFTVNADRIARHELRGRPVVPFEEIDKNFPPDGFEMFIAVGFSEMNKARARLYACCKERGYRLISYINSKATQWGEVELGDNCFVFEANVIQPFVRIGNNVIIWSGNHIGHHVTIGNHCFIASHVVISGKTKIGDYCFLGVNATIRDGITISPECFIGAGALITKNTRPQEVYKIAAADLAAIPSTRLRM